MYDAAAANRPNECEERRALSALRERDLGREVLRDVRDPPRGRVLRVRGAHQRGKPVLR